MDSSDYTNKYFLFFLQDKEYESPNLIHHV